MAQDRRDDDFRYRDYGDRDRWSAGRDDSYGTSRDRYGNDTEYGRGREHRGRDSDFGRGMEEGRFGRSDSGRDRSRDANTYDAYNRDRYSSDFPGRDESRGGWSSDAGVYGRREEWRNRDDGRDRDDWRSRGWGGRDTGSYRDAGDYRSGDYRNDRDQRPFFDRAADEVSSWFGDRNAERRREQDQYRGRGPSNYSRSDDRIREDVNDKLTDDWGVDATNIDVAVSNGEVTLTGTVSTRDQRRRAEDVAEQVSGANHVQNNLRVRDERGGGDRSGGWSSNQPRDKTDASTASTTSAGNTGAASTSASGVSNSTSGTTSNWSATPSTPTRS